MKIQKIQLKNFKRFTDLTIDGISTTTKLVLLIGANGSGKSSVFDAFDTIKLHINRNYIFDRNNYKTYYTKNQDYGFDIIISTNLGIISKNDYYGGVINGDKLSTRFFGRSSIRIVPKILNQANISQIQTDSDNPKTYIENDTRFINDVFAYIAEIDKALREPVFRGQSADTLKIFQDFIAPLNSSLLNIFGGDETTTIQIAEYQNATSSEPAKLIFRKGESKINYDLLSHGEKQVVILLLNFIVRKKYYEDAIIFIDEMDCHLNTALQFNLLKEIVEVWIPDSSQLWTASHALGFIEYAHKSENAVIIDFDSLNFDLPQTLLPQPKEFLDVYDIAIPKNMLSQFFEGKRIVFCENKNDEWFNLLGIKNTIFVGGKDSRDVFLHVRKDLTNHGLRDRDFLTDNEIIELKKEYPNYHILKYYDFENYLYHPDNIQEVNPDGFDKNKYIKEIIEQKNQRFHGILMTVVSSRQTYEEFKTNEKLKDKELDSIGKDLGCDDFESFYKFFDMKTQFNKTSIAKLNLPKEKLVSTNWFKSKIREVLEN
ncbi:MAG: AAA family ATPase [Chitinophagales bacterium]|jgi:AAA15 family ATPase/GTPase|nr:AAA family ATPase [Chitinophagales bacterium]